MKHSKNRKAFFTTLSIFLTLVASVHLIRVIAGWEAYVANWQVPLWFSILAVLFVGWLAYEAWQVQCSCTKKGCCRK